MFQTSSAEGTSGGPIRRYDAATAFQNLMTRFQEDAQKIQQALDQIGTSLDQSYTTYQRQEEEQEEARALAPELAARWPESPEIQHMARVLEPPKILPNKPGPRARPLKSEHEWLAQHAHEYPGCWIAVYGDRLTAAGPDLTAVSAEVRQAIGDEAALVHYEPADPA